MKWPGYEAAPDQSGWEARGWARTPAPAWAMSRSIEFRREEHKAEALWIGAGGQTWHAKEMRRDAEKE